MQTSNQLVAQLLSEHKALIENRSPNFQLSTFNFQLSIVFLQVYSPSARKYYEKS